MSVFDIDIADLTGRPDELTRHRGQALLVVNVASQCELHGQYAGLQELWTRYCDRGLVVLAAPCDQFANQEPGTPEEIIEFCSTTYGVTFPMTEKIEVNGPGAHPLYSVLTRAADSDGHTGDVRWNYEKFVVSPAGTVVARFGPTVEPQDDRLVAAIERVLPDRVPTA